MTYTFNLKEKSKDGLTLIYLKAYFKNEGKRFVYSTGEFIHPKEWDIKNRQPNNLTGRTSKADSHRTIKRQLDRYSNFFIQVTETFKNTNQELTVEKVRKEFDKEFKRVAKGKNKFYEAYDEFMLFKQKNQEWSKATIKRYYNIKSLLEDFEKTKNYKITFNTINQKFYTEFTDFCMVQRGHINNTFTRNVGLVKTFLYWALKNGHTYKSDFIKFKKKPKVITNQIALRKEDLELLLKVEMPSKKLERVKDIFIFSCVTGMRFGELKYVSKNTINGKVLLLKEEKGSGKKSREIPLSNIALHILNKYDYTLPLIGNQKFNDYIKEVFEKAGYTHNVVKTSTRGKEVLREEMPFYKRISSHTARRTFITMMKRNGKSDKLIAEISGHNDMKTLNQYYQISNEDVKDAVHDTFNIEI
ncbi:site-specific integrase [Tenacibaculum sp. XPcli2-G]|uniref:tyrosine-type recombinase/integrase n=1 Tax=Tenacibaculum sp. XPcli2-G TaxID=2954503 RepID=UPI002097572F|nr:tyrosine-type recombinase/integrase [Tenacibaculum sp. XPcli2-G]MCO7185013.1 site-specific integrase [Tenacibaculum sp. XPcli2-G]